MSVPAGSNATSTVIDLVDFQAVDDPTPQPSNSVSVTDFGADASGIGDSANAFDLAIQSANASAKPPSIPPPTFQVNTHVIPDNPTVTAPPPTTPCPNTT